MPRSSSPGLSCVLVPPVYPRVYAFHCGPCEGAGACLSVIVGSAARALSPIAQGRGIHLVSLVGVAPEVGNDVRGAGERRFSILPIISNSRCATRTIRYSDKRPLCFARRPTTESAIFE